MSKLAGLTLEHVGDEKRFPEWLFNKVYRELFPQDGAVPTLLDVMQRDLSAGIACLRHVGLPLIVEKPLVRRCVVMAAGRVLLNMKGLRPLLDMQQLGQLVQDMAKDGTVPDVSRMLAGQRDALRMRRNQLDGWDHAMSRRLRVVHPQRVEPEVEPKQTDLLDILELEQVLRRLHMVCAVERICHESGFDFEPYSPKYSVIQWAVVQVEAALRGSYQPREEKPFALKSRQEIACSRRLALAFLEIYEDVPYCFREPEVSRNDAKVA